MSQVHVRPLRPPENQAVAALIRETLRTVNARDYTAVTIEQLCDHYSPARLAALAEAADLLVALDDSGIVGTAALHGDRVEGVFVRSDCQGRGIGRALMAALEATARSRALPALHLRSSLTAHPFYRRLGYTPHQRLPDPFGGDVITMSKRLAQD